MTQIILNQPHTHNGVLHAIGEELDVLLHDAEYLVQYGIANFKRGVQKRAVTEPTTIEPDTAAGEPAAETDAVDREPATPDPATPGDSA